ncbi:MAG: ComF family protein [Betaproteobacteria bacterium]
MSLFRHILGLLLPSSCSYCRSPIGDSGIPYFCSSCWADFAPLVGPLCPTCGRPFESPETLLHSPGHLCRACRQSPPKFDQALAVGQFEGPLREAIHQYKYRPCRSLGKPLGEWMAEGVRLLANIDMVMPVPLHPKRLKQRGFNQALLLAYRMSERHKVPLLCDNLIRMRATRPQVELKGDERIKNVEGAFTLRQPSKVTGKSVVLVDDVFTTGATMNECAAVLKQAGATQVTAFTLARTI